MPQPHAVRRLRVPILLGAGLALCAPAAPALAAEGADRTLSIEAIAPWTAEGRLIENEGGMAFMAAVIEGDLFIMTPQGPAPSGVMACVGMFELEVDAGAQSGSGHCEFTAGDGAKAFATWSCEGYHLVGCRGAFTLTGGTGRLEGLTGEGPVVMRSSLQLVARNANDSVSGTAKGIAWWEKLDLSLPAEP